MRISDWSSDVCSSDLLIEILADALGADVELHVDLGCGLPLIDGGRARIFERQILHILRDEPDRRTVVLAVAQRFGGEFGCGLIGHGIGLSLESDRKTLRCQAPVSGGTGGCGALSSGGREAPWAAGRPDRRCVGNT